MTQEGAQPNPSEMIYLAEKWSSHAQEYRSYRVQCGTRLDTIPKEYYFLATYPLGNVSLSRPPYDERSKTKKMFFVATRPTQKCEFSGFQ